MSQTAERGFSIGPSSGMAIECISLTFALELDREWITGNSAVIHCRILRRRGYSAQPQAGSTVQGQADAVVSVLLRLGTQRMRRPPVSAVDISTARPGVNDPVFVLK